MVSRLARIAATAFDTGMSTFCAAARFTQHRRGERTLGELADRRGLAAPEREAEREIARLRGRAAEQEIAKSRQAGQRLGARAAGAAQPGELAEAARGQRGERGGAEILPTTMPAAIASTFLAAPPISTPRTSVV